MGPLEVRANQKESMSCARELIGMVRENGILQSTPMSRPLLTRDINMALAHPQGLGPAQKRNDSHAASL